MKQPYQQLGLSSVQVALAHRSRTFFRKVSLTKFFNP